MTGWKETALVKCKLRGEEMPWIESLQKAIDYIEEHLLEELTIKAIARQANVSPYHFQRSFLILTDVTVGEYLRRRRLTLAAQDLTSTTEKIIEIAYKYGYDTPESFTKAFRKQHGVTPSEVRKGIGKLQAYNRLTIQVKLKGAEPMKYRIVERNGFQVVGIKREFPCGKMDVGIPGIPGFWSELHENGKINQLSQLINGQIKGLLGITGNYNEEKNKIDYWIAAEHCGEVPGGLLSLDIPQSKWVVFEVKGPIPTAIINTWKRIYSEWFPSSGYEPAKIVPLEAYIDSDLYSQDSTNEIWIAIK
jgi:AraC family transcriptional regulator